MARPKVRIVVKVKGMKRPVGRIVVKDGRNKVASVKLKAGKRGRTTVTLPRLSVGRHKITVSFRGSGAKAKKAIIIRVRR